MTLDHDLEVALCARPCGRFYWTRRVLHPDGTEEIRGDPPPPLCSACPERDNPQRRVRHIEVVCNRRGTFNKASVPASVPASGATPSGAIARSSAPRERGHDETLPLNLEEPIEEPYEEAPQPHRGKTCPSRLRGVRTILPYSLRLGKPNSSLPAGEARIAQGMTARYGPRTSA